MNNKISKQLLIPVVTLLILVSIVTACSNSDEPEIITTSEYPSQEVFQNEINGHLWQLVEDSRHFTDEDGNEVPGDILHIWIGLVTTRDYICLWDNKAIIFTRGMPSGSTYYKSTSYNEKTGAIDGLGSKGAYDTGCRILSLKNDTLEVKNFVIKWDVTEDEYNEEEIEYKYEDVRQFYNKEIYFQAKYVKVENPDYKELFRTHLHLDYDPDTIGLY